MGMEKQLEIIELRTKLEYTEKVKERLADYALSMEELVQEMTNREIAYKKTIVELENALRKQDGTTNTY